MRRPVGALVRGLASSLLPGRVFRAKFDFLVVLGKGSLLGLSDGILVFVVDNAVGISSTRRRLTAIERQRVFF